VIKDYVVEKAKNYINGVNADLFKTLHVFPDSNILLKAYQKSNNLNLLIFYLIDHKNDKEILYKYKDILTSVKANKVQSYYLKYLYDNNTKNKDSLLKLRQFNLLDIKLFDVLNIKKDDDIKINKLCNYWLNQSSNTQLYDFKTIVIIHGFHIIDKYRSILDIKNNLNSNTIPNTHLKLDTYKRILYANYTQGRYYNNLKYYRNLLIPLSEWLGNKNDIIYMHLSYGNTLFRLGKIKDAQKQYEIAFNLTESSKKFNNYTSVVNNLAVTYLRTGDFNKYIKLQLNALGLASRNDNYQKQLFILNNLSIYYKDINDYKSALLYSKKAKHIALNHNLNQELAYVHLAIGYIYQGMKKNYYKSLNEYKKAIEIADSLNNYNIWRAAYFDKANIYEDQKQFYKALSIRKKISSKTRENKDDKNHIDNLTNIVDDLLRLKKFKSAKEYFEKIKDINTSILDHDTNIKRNNDYAKILIYSNNYSKAVDILKTTISEILNWARNSAEVQSGHLLLKPHDLESFKLLTNLYIKTYKYDQALINLDKIKTINKVRYANNSFLKSNILSEKKLNKDQNLGNYIESLRSKLQSATKSQKINIQNNLSEAISEKKQLESNIIKYNDDSDVNISVIKRHLKHNEAILYFTQFQNQIYLATITRNSTKFDTLQFSNTQLDTIKNVIKAFHNGHTNLKKLKWIYNLLLAKVDLSNYDKLDVIPDGFLYELPIGILPVNKIDSPISYGSAHYLIEKHPISYYTSLKNFEHTFHEKAHHYNTSFLGVGISKFRGLASVLSGNKTLAPLPFTQIEVSKIDSTIPGKQDKKKLFLGKDGTEKSFRKWVSSARIVHLATHSEVYYEDPLFSVIYLEQDSTKQNKKSFKDDGQIHAYELFEMNLNSKMVMLSSCESGAGDYITGSGMIGLSRALTYAGAQSLVLNLWSINDQTAANISIRFYKYLIEGYSKAEALRKAKLYFLNTGNSNPYQWGSFVVTGDPSPLFSRYPYLTSIWSYLTGGILIIALIGFVYRRYGK